MRMFNKFIRATNLITNKITRSCFIMLYSQERDQNVRFKRFNN